MYSFSCGKANAKLMRTYVFKHCYEEARLFDKSKNPNVYSNCIIIRKQKTKNQTDFGYKQQLKTGILKKIHFVYLQSFQDLIAFLWAHLQSKEILFGMLVIQNIENYVGQSFDYRECGKPFLTIMKLLRLIVNKIRIKGRVCISYAYNEMIFQKKEFGEFLKSEEIFDWEITQKAILKNGQLFQTDQTKQFYQIYGTNQNHS